MQVMRTQDLDPAYRPTCPKEGVASKQVDAVGDGMSRRTWFRRDGHSPMSSVVSGPQRETRVFRGDDPRSSSRSAANSDAPVGERRSRVIAQDVKIEVAARDGGRCRQCGSNKELHFDHVIPWSKGGANTADNIQLLCGTCNRRKGADDIPAN